MWGLAYVGFLYPIVYALDAFARNGDLFFFLFGILWVGDTAAMAVGKNLGRHKLAPTVSPNKTVEGFVGGLIGAACIGVLMNFWLFPQAGLENLLLVAVGCSLFGQVGDLAESMWKRSLGIKDSSAIIPGHGGVLDRFDSLLFAAPFMYFWVRVIGL
jgi:phosphatidate cytidylyltransferase